MRKNQINFDMKHYLIEDIEQFNSKFKGDGFNFSRCIFLTTVLFTKQEYAGKVDLSDACFLSGCDFSRTKFKGEVDFSGAFLSYFSIMTTDFWAVDFFEKVDFSGTTFSNVAMFSKAHFHKKVYFSGSQFFENILLWDVTFSDGAFFDNAQFHKKVVFRQSQFLSDASFEESNFAGEVDFAEVGFSKNANFQNVQFTQQINFQFANIEKILVLRRTSGKNKPLAIDLKGAVVNNIDYTNAEFAPENRETAMVLKGIAIKRYDQVAALKFQRQEMEIYLDELRNSDGKGSIFKKLYAAVVGFFRKYLKPADTFVLRVEELTSDFGTNPLQAVSWLAVWNAVFFGVAWWMKGCLPDSPLDAMEELGLLQIIYHPINVFLIYEFVKSLRKFSRRL